MSNVIDAVFAKQALNEVEQLVNGLTEARRLQIEINKGAQTSQKNVGTVRTSSDATTRMNSNSGFVDDSAKVIASRQKIDKELERAHQADVKRINQRIAYQQKLEKQAAKEGVAVEKAAARYDAAQKKEAAALAKSQGLYNTVQREVSQLTQAYNNLAIKKNLGNRLTAAEEGQLNSLTGRLNQYQSALKKTDADIQKYQRNVGNYGSAYNGLGNSINQLTREAPAFAVSLNTGFLALSNNLPILFDEIQRTKDGIAALKAEGKSAPSVMSQLASSVFSVQTALSLLVLGLTLYGGQIVDAITGSKAREAALKAEKEAIEEKIEAEKRATAEIGDTIAAETNRSRILFELAKNEKNTSKQRSDAIKELRSRYPAYLKDLSDEQLLAGNTAEAEERLNAALINRGKALAAQSLLQQNASKQLQAQIEYEKVLNKGFNNLTSQRGVTGAIKNEQAYAKSLRESALSNSAAAEAMEKKLIPLRDEEAALLRLFNENSKYLDIVHETTGANKKASDRNVEGINAQTESMNGFLLVLEKSRSELEQLQSASSSAEEFQSFQKVIDEYTTVINMIRLGSAELKKSGEEGVKAFEKIRHDARLTKEELEILTNTVNEYLSAFDTSSLSEFGFKSLDIFTTIEENGRTAFQNLLAQANETGQAFAVTFTAISEVAQDAFNFIEDLQQEQFESQIERLDHQKEIALAYAGEGAAARAQVEREFEERRKKIAHQQAEEQKRQAMFNVGINTAQSAVSAYASQLVPGDPTSLIRAQIAAAIATAFGLAQLAIVASKQVPAFEKGTENAPLGWAKVDERGAEIHTDRHGNVKSLGSTKGANYRWLDEGDKIIPADKSKQILSYGEFVASQGVTPSWVQSTTQLPAIKLDYARLGMEVGDAVKRNQKESRLEMSFDERGVNIYKTENGQTKQLLNAKLRIRS